MKKTIWAAVALAMIIGGPLFASCDKATDINTAGLEQSKGTTSQLKIDEKTRQEVAASIALAMGSSHQAIQELNNAINTVVTYYGLDEILTFYDILNTKNSVFLSEDFPITNLVDVLSKLEIIGLPDFDENNYYGNLLLYWPFHDNWDKKTTPIICFAPMDESATSAIGYYYDGTDVVSVEIEESQIDDGTCPVIIINDNEYRYTEYPNFKNGERIKGNTIWGKISDLLPVHPWSFNITGSDTIYEAGGHSFTSSGIQYDTWIRGGSEFHFTTAYVMKDGSTDTLQCIIPLTRKEIKKKSTIGIQLLLHPDWHYKCNKIYIYFCEHDQWGSIDTMNINLAYEDNSVSTAIKFNDADDLIHKGYFYRPNYINKCVYGDGVYILGRETINCHLNIFSTPTF